MKILLCHNYYQQPGGEDLSFAAEADLLESRGHEVIRYTRHNDAIPDMTRLGVAARTFWNRATYREVRQLVRRQRPDVVHCTNTFPLLSPAVYYAARSEGTPVVQSLRNYRQLCPGAYLMRDGKICEDCLGRIVAWPGVVHGCYRRSRFAAAVVAGMAATHRLLGTWSHAVDRYFTPTEFVRQKFIQAGWPADRIDVKPNFVHPDPGPGAGNGGYAIFVGRLSEEKGVRTLLAAWRQLDPPVPLKIVGQGPLASEVESFVTANPHVELLSQLPLGEVLELIGGARFLIAPSLWYETFCRTVVEAFAKQTPVVASNLGAMAELIDDGNTGLLFTPGDATDLAAKARQLWQNPAMARKMGERARNVYLDHYTAEPNYQMLLEIYGQAIDRSRAQAKVPALAWHRL